MIHLRLAGVAAGADAQLMLPYGVTDTTTPTLTGGTLPAKPPAGGTHEEDSRPRKGAR